MTRPTPISSELSFDAAAGATPGRRARQEDAIALDFPRGATTGFAVLADGMGGHAAGEIAATLAVTEVFAELKLRSGEADRFAAHLPAILAQAARAANECIHDEARAARVEGGMGTTLVAAVCARDRLFWVSVGDSPLYLFRQGALYRLNENHSMAARFDAMVREGAMALREALEHPDRNCLTSALGMRRIRQVDCPRAPVRLCDGDVIVVASDGIDHLGAEAIAGLIAGHRGAASSEIADRLLRAIEDKGDPTQDNMTFAVIKVAKHPAPASARSSPVTAPVQPPVPAPAGVWSRLALWLGGGAAARGARQ